MHMYDKKKYDYGNRTEKLRHGPGFHSDNTSFRECTPDGKCMAYASDLSFTATRVNLAGCISET